jgi:hypothetical protein
MAQLQTYRVVREHIGDRAYKEGDTRTALPTDVGHLVPHVLVLTQPIVIDEIKLLNDPQGDRDAARQAQARTAKEVSAVDGSPFGSAAPIGDGGKAIPPVRPNRTPARGCCDHKRPEKGKLEWHSQDGTAAATFP